MLIGLIKYKLAKRKVIKAFEKLAKNNGLNVSIDFNVHRAWFNDKDFLMSINTRKEFQ